MAHICAAQQGIPVEQREHKLRGFDVYNDPVRVLNASVARGATGRSRMARRWHADETPDNSLNLSSFFVCPHTVVHKADGVA